MLFYVCRNLFTPFSIGQSTPLQSKVYICTKIRIIIENNLSKLSFFTYFFALKN